MDPYFEIYIPRLTRTLKLSKLRALTKLHNPKRYNEAEDRERWEKSHQHDAAKLEQSAEDFFIYIGEKLVCREDKRKVSEAMWTIIGVLEGNGACGRTHCQHNNSRSPYSCDAGKRTHICKEYDKYMRRKAFGADVCKDCRYASQTKKWGAVCFMPQYNPKVPQGCPREREAS